MTTELKPAGKTMAHKAIFFHDARVRENRLAPLLHLVLEDRRQGVVVFGEDMPLMAYDFIGDVLTTRPIGDLFSTASGDLSGAITAYNTQAGERTRIAEIRFLR